MKSKFIWPMGFLFFSNLAQAQIQFSVFGPCQKLFSTTIYQNFQHVGELTIETLSHHQFSYKGTEQGINSIENSPMGLDALEVINDHEMRSYGWCYQVDDRIPEIYPHEFFITNNIKKIIWFYGYAEYKSGQWVSQCRSSHQLKPEAFCTSLRISSD